MLAYELYTPEFIDAHRANVKSNLHTRYSMLSKSREDKKAQAILMEKCRRDIKFFFEHFLYTDRNKLFEYLEIQDMPFMLFDYQKEAVDEIWRCIVEGKKVFIEKSRQLGLSWIICGIFLYGFLFHGHKYTMITMTQDELDKTWDIDSLFEKIRYMIRLLPGWMLPEWFSKEAGTQYNQSGTISHPKGTGSINGKTGGKPDAGRWGTRNATFLDEMASLTYARQINMSIGSSSPCVIYNSTPKGEFNEFFEMRKKAMLGEIEGLRYHWTEHPFYNTAWHEWYCRGKSEEAIAQELEIDYNVAVKGRVYQNFKSLESGGDVTFGDFEYNPSLPVYYSIDNSHGWSDPHAVIVWQTDYKTDKWTVIDWIEVNCSVDEMAEFLAKQPRQGFHMDDEVYEFYQRYLNYKKGIYIADPYDTDSTINDATIRQKYAKVGIHLYKKDSDLKQSTVEQRIQDTKSNLHRFKVSNSCKGFISAVSNARYPEQKSDIINSTQAKTKPIHDQTSHYRTSMEYFVDYYLNEEKRLQQRDMRKPVTRQVADPITGEIRYVTR